MTAPPGEMGFGASRRKKIARRRNTELAPGKEIVAHQKISFERLARWRAHGRQSLTAPFAAHMDEALLVAHRGERQGHKLADAQTRGIEHLHDAEQARRFRTVFDSLACGIDQSERLGGG